MRHMQEKTFRRDYGLIFFRDWYTFSTTVLIVASDRGNKPDPFTSKEGDHSVFIFIGVWATSDEAD